MLTYLVFPLAPRVPAPVQLATTHLQPPTMGGCPPMSSSADIAHLPPIHGYRGPREPEGGRTIDRRNASAERARNRRTASTSSTNLPRVRTSTSSNPFLSGVRSASTSALPSSSNIPSGPATASSSATTPVEDLPDLIPRDPSTDIEVASFIFIPAAVRAPLPPLCPLAANPTSPSLATYPWPSLVTQSPGLCGPQPSSLS